MNPILSASIMCADPLRMGDAIGPLVQNGVQYLHCDVMDGHFVPNLMLSTETIRALKADGRLPLDIHLMVEKPETMIPWLAMGEGDIVSIHYESTPHVQRALSMIRQRGATPALAINPATPLDVVREVTMDIGMLLLMTVNPGFAAQTLVPQGLEKIRRARSLLNEWGAARIPIQVDGNCSFENIPKMAAQGAELFVVGTSSIFNPDIGMKEGTQRIRDSLAALPLQR